MTLFVPRASLLLAFAGCAWPQSLEGVRAFIREQLVERKVPSVAIAMARDGKILWEEAFGWADRENRVAATEHTMYSLASISKPVTATGLMVLRERGAIDLDAPINIYLGTSPVRGLAGDASGATVRRVAGHTAGLPLHYHFFYADEPYRPPPMEETIRRYGILVTPPGERYEYSNLGFGILGHVIARAAGVPYADFMRQNVFLPLGLTHTSVHVGAGLNRYAAERYGTDGLRLPPYGFDHDAASAVYASVHDLVRFGMFHLKAHLPDQRRILTDEAIDQMQRGSGYGIGWSLSERSGYAVVQHAGSMGGVSTLLMLVPGEKIAVAAVCNASGSLAAEAAHRAIATLLPKWDARVSSTHAAPVEPPAWQPPPELIGSWSGRLVTWKAEHPFTMRVLESGDVHVRLGAQLRTLLNGVVFEGGVLRGRMHGEVGTEDAGRTRHFLQLALTLRGAVLNGPATSLSVAAPRPGNALTSWLELKKQ